MNCFDKLFYNFASKFNNQAWYIYSRSTFPSKSFRYVTLTAYASYYQYKQQIAIPSHYHSLYVLLLQFSLKHIVTYHMNAIRVAILSSDSWFHRGLSYCYQNPPDIAIILLTLDADGRTLRSNALVLLLAVVPRKLILVKLNVTHLLLCIKHINRWM